MTAPHSDTIELGHVARTVARGWRAVVGFTAFGIVVAVAIILFAPPKYTGVTTLVLKSGGGSSSGTSVLSQVSGLGDLTAGLLGGKSPMETEVEVMSSRAVIGDVVDSLFLQARITAPRAVPARQLITRLDAPGSFAMRKYHFERNPDGKSYRVSGDDAPKEMIPGTPMPLAAGSIVFSSTSLPADFDMTLRDKADAALWVTKHVKVAKEKGEVASITYRGDDSLTAARVPNTLLDVYLGRRKGSDRGINQRRVEFLTMQSDSMERALAVASNALRRQQEASGMLDPKTVARVELESGSNLRSKLTDVMVQQGALRQLMDQIEAKTRSPRDLAAYPQFVGNPVVSSLVAQLSDFDTKRTILLASHAETDRDVVALDKSAADIEAKLLPYAHSYAEALARERADLEASLARINENLATLPKATEASSQMESDVLGLTKLLAGIQGQIVEAKLAAIGEGGDVRPLDLAIAPKKPSFPDPLITAGIGTFGGLFFGLIAAVLIGSVGRWMRDPVEVERTTGVPALQFDPSVPLLLTSGASRTIVVAPIEAGMSVTAVVNRLAQTAASRSLSAVVLNLPETAADVNASIARLEAEHDLVIVQLPSLVSDTAAAALQHTRPVLLVAPGRRIERRRLLGAVQMLKRIEVPVAGIVMSNGTADGRALTR